MQEFVPVVIGIAIGIVVGRRTTRRAVVAALAASLALGVLVAWMTGELAHSVGYAIFDAGVAACTAGLVVTAHRVALRASRTDQNTLKEAGRG
jgi:hypothetical protein